MRFHKGLRYLNVINVNLSITKTLSESYGHQALEQILKELRSKNILNYKENVF